MVWIGVPDSGARFIRDHDRDVRVQVIPAERAPKVSVCPHTTAPIKFNPAEKNHE